MVCICCISISFLAPLAHLHVLVLPGATAFPLITLGALISKSILGKGCIREEIERKYNGEKIAILNLFAIYRLSIYKNECENDYKKNVFFLLQRKIESNVEEEGWSAYL